MNFNVEDNIIRDTYYQHIENSNRIRTKSVHWVDVIFSSNQYYGYWWPGDARSKGNSSLQWRHNERDGVSNHQPHDCLLNPFIQAQIKENIKALRHRPLCWEFTGDRWIPHKGPVTRKMFLFDDVIMCHVVQICPYYSSFCTRKIQAWTCDV